MGRPRLSKNELREVVPVRLTVGEKEAFNYAAKANGLTLSEWIRKALKRIAIEEWRARRRVSSE